MGRCTAAGRGLAAVAAAVGLLASGCGSDAGPAAPEEPAVVRRQVDVDGMERTYRLFTPPSVEDDRPLPLVLALHGSNNTPDSFVQASQLDVAASANRFVVAYPEAVRLLWNGGFCCTGGRGGPADDVRFLDRVISDVSSLRPIDTTRIFAVGVSAGGIMAYRLACDLPGRITGVAAVAGSMQLDDCRPANPVSVIALHGTGDQLVPYEGGRIIGAANRPAPPAMAVAERWASLNRCPGPGTATTEGPVTTTSWAGCAHGTAVRMVTVEGAGHNWFNKDFGLPNGAVDATTVILEFFDLVRRP